MLNLKWNIIQELKEKLARDHQPDSVIDLHISKGQEKPIIIRKPFKDFLTVMWEKYDDQDIYTRFAVVSKKKVFFKFDGSVADPNRIPKQGNPIPIIQWNKTSGDKRKAWMKLLMSQISEHTTTNKSQSSGKR